MNIVIMLMIDTTMTNGLIGDSLLGVALNDSLIQSANEPLCDTVREVAGQGFQTNSFDRWSLVIAIIACAVAVITCIVAVFQLRHQIKQFNESQERDDKVRKETKSYINQIRVQILNNSLLCLIDKKHDFLEGYNDLYKYFLSHSTQLLNDLKIKYDEIVFTNIRKIDYNLNIIEDTICFLGEAQSVEEKSRVFVSLLKEIKKQEGVAADLKEVELWLSKFENAKNELIQAIDNSYNSIKQSINNKI